MASLPIAFIITLCLTPTVLSLPEGWILKGCWSDNVDGRALQAASYFDPVFSTQDSCVEFCDQRGYPIAGAEFGRECYCDNKIQDGSVETSLQDCNISCPFSSSTMCGGANRLSLFTKVGGPVLVTEVPMGAQGTWNYVGSFNNTKPQSEPFTVEAVVAGTVDTSGSVENCLSWCFENIGCPLCSISDGGVCECGNTLSGGRIQAGTGSAVCSRNTSEICGDTGVWQVYQFQAN